MTGPEFTRANEGCRLTAYRDQGGVWTIGWGHTGPGVVEGLTCSQEQADAWFADDYTIAGDGAERAVGSAWDGIGNVRQAAVTDMAFQLGGTGLAAFHKMLAALRAYQWVSAAAECRASRYAEQVPVRAAKVAGMLESGAWPA